MEATVALTLTEYDVHQVLHQSSGRMNTTLRGMHQSNTETHLTLAPHLFTRLHAIRMPCVSKMAARAAHRTAMMLPSLLRSREHSQKSSAIGPGSCTHAFLYCSKTLVSEASWDRHITLRPYCHARHKLSLRQKFSKRHQNRHKRKQNGDDLESDLGDPNEPGTVDNGSPSKYSKVNDDAAPSNLPQTPEASPGGERPSNSSGDAIPSDERICKEPFVQKFPIPTAGEPIVAETRPMSDLHAYVNSCGNLRDPKLFDKAELLMTTVPKGKDHTKHLQTEEVSTLNINVTLYLSLGSSTAGRHHGATTLHY